jgi:hypothetical protein
VIYAVTGTPGAGKSWYAVKRVLDAIQRGQPVATNVTLVEGWAELLARRSLRLRLSRRNMRRTIERYESLLHQLPPEDPAELLRIRLGGRGEGRGIAVLDEAHEWLNARFWAEADRKDLVRWFSTHRHYGWDVYLLTQYLDSIDKQVRDRVEWHVVCRNLRNHKALGIRWVPFNLFLAIHVWSGGPTTLRHIGKRELYLLDKRRALYDTHGLAFDPDGDKDAIWLPRPRGLRPAAGATRDSAPPPAAQAIELSHSARGRTRRRR